jgi:tRNA-splicing endonuclease subunit Sen2
MKRGWKLELAKYNAHPDPQRVFKVLYDGMMFTANDANDIDGLWYAGSYGKGSQSRSQPQNHKSTTNEFLILTPTEVLHLKWIYQCLDIRDTRNGSEWTMERLWRHLIFPDFRFQTAPQLCQYLISNRILFEYCTYHHYKALGWVLRSGMQFGCDFLMYRHGPALDHAAFGILICPFVRLINHMGQTVNEWSAETEWPDIVATSRIMSSTRKVLKLVHLVFQLKSDEITPIFIEELMKDPSKILSIAAVRHVDLQRWVPERTRNK